VVRVKLRETMKYTRDVYTSLLTSQFHLLGVSSVQRDDCVLLQPSNHRQSVLYVALLIVDPILLPSVL